MQSFKRILDFIITSSLWVAFSVVSLISITCLEYSIEPNINVLLLGFFATVFGYNFVKFFEKGQLHKMTYKAIKTQFVELTSKMKVNLLLSLVCFMISVCCFMFLQPASKLFLLCPAVLTFFYSNPLNNKTLRSISGLKVFIIAICWTLITVGLPVIEYGLAIHTDIYIKSLQCFLFVVTITLPFEIRDMHTDPFSLGTIPQKVGIRKTKLLGLFFVMISWLLEFFKDGFIVQNLWILSLVFVISLLGLFLSKEKQSKYYASFWIEGIPVLWMLLILVF